MTTSIIAPRLRQDRLVTWTAAMFVASMATLVQSYLFIKLFFLALFLLVSMVSVVFRNARIALHGRLVWFYLWIGMVGGTWALVGALHHNNYIQANVDAFRLYVIWSAGFVVLYTLLRLAPSLEILHRAMIAAGILIPVINLMALYEELSGRTLIGESIREQLQLSIGFGDGYIQFTSMNITSMFVIAPYLLSLQFRSDAGRWNSGPARVALVLSIILAAVSGRRALWIVVALTPCTILLISLLTGSYELLRAGGRRFLLGCVAVSVLGIGVFLLFPGRGADIGTVDRLEDAFSAEDFRTIQKPYLMQAFMKSPVLGSGFGAYAGYTRNDEHPWMYELTYYQMLFNLGLVGVTALGMLIFLYLTKVVRLLRQFKTDSAIPFALFVAFCSLLVGAYSNPYLGGFDSLFFLGLLPFLSTFVRGFERG